MARKLVVEIVGDASSLERSFKRAQASTKHLDDDLGKASRGALAASVSFGGMGRSIAFASGAFLGGAGIVAGFRSAVSAASNLAEQTSKTNVVFGESAKEIEAWSHTTTNALGLASDQALQTASSFGALLRPIGLTGEAAADQSKRLTQLGADLASFYNTSVQDALDAIRSGLVGEVEPLRRYGVLLSETRVQQEAFAETGKKTATALTPQEKLMARLAIVFRDTSRAQGDFARTSGGLANQERILQANIRELEIELGQGLIPAVRGVVKALNSGISAFQKFKNELPASNYSGLDFFKDLGKHAGDIARATPVIGSLLRTISDKGPNEGWTPFFDAITNLVKTGNVQAKLAAVEAGITQIAEASPAKKGAAAVTAAQLRAIALAQFGGTGTKQEIAAIRAQIAADNAAIAFANKRIQEGNGNVRAFADALAKLYSERSSLLDRIDQINEDQATKAKEQADKAKAARKKYMEHLRSLFEGPPTQVALSKTTIDAIVRRALRQYRDQNKKLAQQLAVVRGRVTQAQRDAAVFTRLGLTPTGEELAPTRKALQAGLANIEKSLKGSILDTDKNRNLIARIRRVLSGELGALNREVRLRIKELEDTLRGDKKTGGPLTEVQAITGRRLAQLLGSGLGLTPQQVRALRLNITGAHFTSGSLGPTMIQTRVDIDGRQVALAIHQQNARSIRRTAPQTRGRVLP